MFEVLIGIASLSVLLTLATHGAALLVLRRRPRPLRRAPAISVLKPLCGDDDGLEANLESLATQAYPGELQILFGAADAHDPALAIARRVRDRHPEIAIEVACLSPRAAHNPKVASLIELAERATHDVLLVSDSNVRVDPGYLAAIAAELDDERVGLVSNVLVGDGEQTLGATLENLQLCGFIAASVCTGHLAGHPCVIGKSMLVRRAALASLGGFAAFADVLGEDYLIGSTMRRAGFRVVLSPHRVRTINETWSVERFAARHLRWAQMRRWISPAAFAVEPLLYPVPWTLLAFAWALGAAATGPRELAGIALLGAAALITEAVLCATARGRAVGLRDLAALALKDLMLPILWTVAWWKKTVSWRGHVFAIGPGSRLGPIAGELSPPAFER